jgi:RND family efflux transporter MFP subunit
MNYFKVFLLGILGWVSLTACSSTPQAAAVSDHAGRGNRPAEQVRQVTTVMAAKRSIDQLVVVTGTLAAEQEIVLGMKVSGRLAEVSVDLGSAVQKDQPVARLDTTDFQLRVRQADAALQQARVRLGLPPDGESEDIELEQTNGVRQARAQMDAARNHLDRMMLLLEKGLVPKTDVNDANLRFKVADAQYADSLDEARNRQAILAQRRSELEIARQQLADAVLYAPISGMVRQRSANVGQYLVAGAPIVTLVQMNPLRLQTAVPEREARSIRTGQSVHVTVEGAPGVHQGRVARISPSFDEANRTLLVETEVSNAANILRPGAFSRAEIVVSSGQQALMVPPSSLATFAGIDRVFTVKDGKASERRVKTGRRTEEGVEILEGISAGDEVVVSPGNIADGENVAVKR